MTDTITLPRAVIEQAIEALRTCYDVYIHPGNGKTYQDDALDAIRTALTEALVVQTNKPAWKCTGDGLKKFLTQSQYDAQPENIKVWYEPFSAPIHSPILTICHCKEKAQPGGYQLHNLQCGYPVCDHKPA